MCLESVKANTKDVNYRYIFVDNNSTDGTLEYLKTIPNSVLIPNSVNLGFVKAMNQGFDHVKSKYVVWLNNDTIVSPGWLKNLIKHLESNPHAVAIGPMSNYTAVTQRVDFVDSKIDVQNISEFGLKFHQRNQHMAVEFHRIAGFCFVMKSELIEEIGKLDESFNFICFDDDDYCKRITEKGYKILIAKDVFVYHQGSTSYTSAKDPEFDLAYLMQKGVRQFLNKWRCPPPVGQKKTDESPPLVSIIMSTRNREKLIKTAIASVISQTYKNWELIVVNDAGADIENIIKSFSDLRIKYIKLDTHRGKSFANNVAIKNSEGELIAYLDDDDCWYPNHLEVAVRELTKYRSRLLVYTDWIRIGCVFNREMGVRIPIKKSIISPANVKKFLQKGVNPDVANFSIVHHRSLFEKGGTFNESLKYYEDADLLIRFSKYAYFCHIPQVTGEYWIDELGLNRNAASLTDPNFHSVVKHLGEEGVKKPLNEIIDELSIADEQKKSGELDLALKHYQKAFEKDPEYDDSVRGIADTLFAMRKFAESAIYWNRLSFLDPYSVEPYFWAARSHIHDHRYDEAKKLLELALLSSDDRSIFYMLESCYRNLGNASTAKLIRDKIDYNVPSIDINEVVGLLRALYGKNIFYRKLMRFCYRILKNINR
jgi:GT2 family glycosyltransferase